ncbi:hypothetical protein [Couchioplanes caeruleus]|uniref:hypothetical protein n=1 Tax=Couchioplanes caeruleus TaxID=56438 RepID=UPI000AA187D2|nr:hypothetical protein [Couchioplanes caeruleus]
MSDTNAPLYDDGVYRLFLQHDPHGPAVGPPCTGGTGGFDGAVSSRRLARTADGRGRRPGDGRGRRPGFYAGLTFTGLPVRPDRGDGVEGG